jgi:hypothetical protein
MRDDNLTDRIKQISDQLTARKSKQFSGADSNVIKTYSTSNAYDVSLVGADAPMTIIGEYYHSTSTNYIFANITFIMYVDSLSSQSTIAETAVPLSSINATMSPSGSSNITPFMITSRLMSSGYTYYFKVFITSPTPGVLQSMAVL